MIYLPCIEFESNPKIEVTGSIIWLHGLGADGNDFVPVAKQLQLPEELNIRFIFPNAPELPVTINNGYLMPAWYDIFDLSLDRKIDVDQLVASAQQVHKLIDREIERGIAAENIIVAGFSQGGAVAYEAALTYPKPLGGLLTLSTYFATHNTIIENTINKNISILIQHGSEDSVVSEVLGLRAHRQLSERGYAAKYESYPMEHTLCLEQIESIRAWLLERFK
ncbi:MAG: carboxylesterase [Gammaproteobacteria bacterium]|nr:MAG: carboxylesterase [Gammaproteobacteria bacterium]